MKTGLRKLSVRELLLLTAFLRRQLTHSRWKGEEEARPFKVGDKVKAVKWRDDGENAERLYVGKVIGWDETNVAAPVQIEIVSHWRFGWKKGDIESESPENLILVK